MSRLSKILGHDSGSDLYEKLKDAAWDKAREESKDRYNEERIDVLDEVIQGLAREIEKLQAKKL